MRIAKSLAAVAAGSLLVAGLAVATAGSASAADNGPLLSGHIYLFKVNAAGVKVSLATATGADIVTSGDGLTRPFASSAVDAACPANTAQSQMRIRIPQVGVDPLNWNEVAINAVSGSKVDANGLPYNDSRVDLLTNPGVLDYVVANGGVNVPMPLTFTCFSAAGAALGYFSTPITMTAPNNLTLTSWSVTAPPAITAASTTTLAASASSVEAGTAVTFTATVAPAAATGTVNFLEGTTTLGSAPVSGGVATFATSALTVGAHSVTAVYAGDSTYGTSTSAAQAVTVTVAAARSTTTTLTVTPVSGDAYQSVAFAAAVAASTGAANGTVTYKDGAAVLGSVPCVSGVVGAFSTNLLGAGNHSFVAVFVGTAPYTDSTSAAVTATYTLVGAAADGTVTVSIPLGAITITTPYSPAAPLALGTATLDPNSSTYSASKPFGDIVITDSRSGNLGFTAKVVSGSFTNAAGSTFGGNYAGLTGLVATQVSGNALQAGNVVLTNHVPFTDGLATAKVFATYAAGQSIGTAKIAGTFGLDKVPSSVTPGLYTATVTLTAV
jgi:hypothetical protein